VCSKPILEATIAPKEIKMFSPRVRTHKEYQEFVKEQLTLRGIDVPFIFKDAFIKLFHLDLSSPTSLTKSFSRR